MYIFHNAKLNTQRASRELVRISFHFDNPRIYFGEYICCPKFKVQEPKTGVDFFHGKDNA